MADWTIKMVSWPSYNSTRQLWPSLGSLRLSSYLVDVLSPNGLWRKLDVDSARSIEQHGICKTFPRLDFRRIPVLFSFNCRRFSILTPFKFETQDWSWAKSEETDLLELLNICTLSSIRRFGTTSFLSWSWIAAISSSAAQPLAWFWRSNGRRPWERVGAKIRKGLRLAMQSPQPMTKPSLGSEGNGTAKHCENSLGCN